MSVTLAAPTERCESRVVLCCAVLKLSHTRLGSMFRRLGQEEEVHVRNESQSASVDTGLTRPSSRTTCHTYDADGSISMDVAEASRISLADRALRQDQDCLPSGEFGIRVTTRSDVVRSINGYDPAIVSITEAWA